MGGRSNTGNGKLWGALQWCHHGIRTKQIKEYLITLDRDRLDGWERWLPVNRPKTFLGSRWMISTKGVFIGLQTAMIGLAIEKSQAFDLLFTAISVGF